MKNYDNILSKKVLITGHTGFKGGWLSFFLKNLDCKIYGISDIENDGIYKLTNVSSLYESEFFLDLNKTSVDELVKTVNKIEPEIVFHFAAQSLVKTAIKKPYETIETNALGTLKVLDAVNKCNSVKQITIATTDKVYKTPNIQNQENDELLGYEFYSASKVAAENFIKAFQNNFQRENLNILTVRSGNVIGGGDRAADRIVTDIVNNILKEKDLEIRNLKHIRPWTYILDSLNGYLLATNYCIERSKNEVFNLNSEINNQFDVEYVLSKFKNLHEFDFIVKNSEEEKLKEVSTLMIDSTKAKNLLGWEAKVELDEIIKLIYNWEIHHSKNKHNDYSFEEVERFLNK